MQHVPVAHGRRKQPHDATNTIARAGKVETVLASTPLGANASDSWFLNEHYVVKPPNDTSEFAWVSSAHLSAGLTMSFAAHRRC